MPQKTVLHVEGFYSDSQKENIETAVNQLEGIHSVNVNIETSEVAVMHDPTSTSGSNIVQALKDIGFTASIRRSTSY